MVTKIDSLFQSLSNAPKDITALVAHWEGLRRGRRYPARRDIVPVALRDYLGLLCIIEVRNDPVDFVYRLFGSTMAGHMSMDLTGKSILELQPAELGQLLFTQVADTITAGAPEYFRTLVSYGVPPRHSGSHRLILPLWDDDVRIDHILTYTRIDLDAPDFWSRILR